MFGCPFLFCTILVLAREKVQAMIHEHILKPFPTNIDLYSADVAPIIEYVISRYGHEEWRAAVLTGELHGHLGIYSTIGVKMGIRAREILNAPHIEIISFAGSQPPLSCMNDGLQVSTGSTIGHGLITLSHDSTTCPKAIFIAEGRTLEMTLKDSYAEQIASDVRYGVEQYGTHSPKYWSYIRHLAIEYWQSFDRHDIFDVVLER